MNSRTSRRPFLSAAAAYAALPAVAAAQTPLGSWTTGTALPTPRSEDSVAALGGTIYVAGGYVPAGPNPVVLEASGHADVDGSLVQAYDVGAGTWSTRASLPRGLNHIGIVGFGGRLYTFGGFDQQNRDAVSDANVYDPATDRWTRIAPVPTGAARSPSLCWAIDPSRRRPGRPQRRHARRLQSGDQPRTRAPRRCRSGATTWGWSPSAASSTRSPAASTTSTTTPRTSTLRSGDQPLVPGRRCPRSAAGWASRSTEIDLRDRRRARRRHVHQQRSLRSASANSWRARPATGGTARHRRGGRQRTLSFPPAGRQRRQPSVGHAVYLHAGVTAGPERCRETQRVGQQMLTTPPSTATPPPPSTLVIPPEISVSPPPPSTLA